MKELKGTKTEANLWTAFAGESQARNKYTYYASKAKKDGYVQIAAIFEETAANEKEHAKNCGSGCSRAVKYLLLPRTCSMPPKVRTMNGPTCMQRWPKRLVKKVSMRLQRHLRAWQRLKKSMRNVIASCSRMWRQEQCSQRMATQSGNAPTAATS